MKRQEHLSTYIAVLVGGGVINNIETILNKMPNFNYCSQQQRWLLCHIEYIIMIYNFPDFFPFLTIFFGFQQRFAFLQLLDSFLQRTAQFLNLKTMKQKGHPMITETSWSPNNPSLLIIDHVDIPPPSIRMIPVSKPQSYI